MERIEYAAIALSGDFAPSEMEKIESAGLSSSFLFRSQIDLNKSKMKNYCKNFPSVVKTISRYKNFITYNDEQYPDALRNIFEPPAVLFFEGELSLLKTQSILAVVGSRKADRYGASIAKEYSKSLSETGIIIIG